MRYMAIIKNQFDNRMRVIPWSKDVARRFVDVIRKPVVVADKSKIPQWKFCSIKGERRCTENIGSTDILMLDYDSPNYSIKAFEDRFRDFRYVLHTSYSYDGEKQKFRVLLFMDKEYEVNRLFFKGAEKQYSPYFYMIDFFDHADPAFAVRAQFFKVPAKNSADAPYYYRFNDGRLFNPFEEIDFYETAYDECEWRQANYMRELEESWERTRKNNNTGDLSKAKVYIEKKIESAEPGTRHQQVFGLACWWKHLGGTFGEFEQVMPSWSDKEYTKQLNHLRHEWARLK